MFTILTVFTAFISVMFIVSVASTISALRRENEDMKAFKEKHSAF